MVLPTFYQLHLLGLLPRDWLLVGNGRGSVSHLDFRTHVHEVLTDVEPPIAAEQWRQFQQRLLFAGGGFDSDYPGSLTADDAVTR
jgi:glucose-6-phosphate 1-dehydrogenase